ncbi:hypothetical protein [Clavibacter michiganensis]|uniref:hypothetical protein n=1 Tax=Clavibacter michiganensis TaxID=28447 RepID=UPI001365F0CC|nr:hypothetical protein [Clavibacter michiganensis]
MHSAKNAMFMVPSFLSVTAVNWEEEGGRDWLPRPPGITFLPCAYAAELLLGGVCCL